MYYWVQIAVFISLFALYWGLLSQLVDAILESPKLTQRYWFLIGALNAGVLFAVSAVWSSVLVLYFVMMTLMLAEFMIFYHDRLSGAILCTLACSIHVISIFMIAVGTFAAVTSAQPHEIVTGKQSFLLCGIISFFLLDAATFMATRLVPLSKVKLINQHQEQQWFIIAWMSVNSVFLVYLAVVFHTSGYSAHSSGSQIAASVTSLISLYVVLFFTIKTSAIMGYKEKNAQLEQVIFQEQQYRNSMVRDAVSFYEINLTQDIVLKSSEDSCSDKENHKPRYSDTLVLLSQKLIYSEDIAEFLRNCGRANILRLVEKGERELITEYRRLLESGSYIWVRSIVNLMQDPETGDVKAFVCVKNIDDEKRNQLELQRRAERDALTGLYNRSTANKLIDEHLAFEESRSASALFMIDVDNFKEINDNLGHVFGDAVLCELGEKLAGIFNPNDIVGRIGGDEYIVFRKDGASPQAVAEKAAEICSAFRISHQGSDGKAHTISSSVGISIFPKDGSNFKELYGCADVALYAAKSEGKDGYKVYDGSRFSGYASQRTEIQTVGNVLQKGFRENRIEYVFKMLYQSENPVTAIHSVLELVARHFSFERGYIFETSKDSKTTNNTFEWCAEGVTAEIENLQRLPIEVVATAHASFQRCGTFILKSLDELHPVERAVLEPQGIKSMFQFGIFDKSRLLGFIGFDNCRNESVPTDTEVDEMKTICNILATFFVKQYIDEVTEKDLLARQEVMNHLDNYIYVINIETFALLFMNDKIQALMKVTEPETPCYSFFRGQTSQCVDCPLRKLTHDGVDRIMSELYNEKLGIWMETSASLMRWTDGSLACLINCTDITKQKEEHLNHVDQLEKLIYADTLTGGRNYHKFRIDAQRILEKQSDTLHFLVKLDIANFKLINQIYGFEKGNEVLCCTAKAIEQTLRNENEIFARITNDEFLALFTIVDKAEIEELNKQFLNNFRLLVGSDFSFQCRFPHGRYLIQPGEAKTLGVHDMFERVNIAHKVAKLNKAIDFAYYDEQMTNEALRVKEIENKMEDALQAEEFTVYLQPKYYLANETIGGAEALTRWNSTKAEFFYPNLFIPIFEQNGFITKLDFYVFEKVCHVIQAWIAQEIEPVTVSVNFSRLHLGNANFVKQLCEIVDRVGIDRKYLEIEITETVIFDNIDTLEILLDDIHKSGFSMSMDDFGSGYSSLGMLKDFPVDVIKMDRSFFADQRDTERSKTVVGSVIQMAANLGIRIVAEGVEEQEHINFLRELNCDMVQGYYYAKPMPVEEFTELLRENGKG